MIVPFTPSPLKRSSLMCKKNSIISAPYSDDWSTLSLANKLQRLVLLDPVVAKVIEKIVDGALEGL